MEEQEQHQALGSVGALWPPVYDKRNNRIKGFYLKTVDDWKQYNQILGELFALREKHDASRITARFIVQDAAEIANCGIEARVSLNGHWTGHSLLYFGQNTSTRYTPEKNEPPEIAVQEDAVVRETMMRTRANPAEALTRIREEGFEFSFLGKPGEKDIAELTTLYSEAYTNYTIPLDRESVKVLVSNTNNLVGIVREKSTGSIVSIGIAERVYTDISCNDSYDGKRLFKFAELSDAATKPTEEYVKKGLYTAIALFLMEKLGQEHFDLVYGEARACRIAVNHACKRTGRMYIGRLLKHCMLNGRREIPEQGPFENLNVWAITYEELQKFFNKID